MYQALPSITSHRSFEWHLQRALDPHAWLSASVSPQTLRIWLDLPCPSRGPSITLSSRHHKAKLCVMTSSFRCCPSPLNFTMRRAALALGAAGLAAGSLTLLGFSSSSIEPAKGLTQSPIPPRSTMVNVQTVSPTSNHHSDIRFGIKEV